MANLFEIATKEQYRFNTTKGTITTEDLWGFSLTDLDSIAKGLNKQIKETSEESFIQKRNTANKTLENKFELVKYIIGLKLAEKEKRAKAAENATRRAQLLEDIAEKEGLARKSKSIEELKAELESLDE